MNRALINTDLTNDLFLKEIASSLSSNAKIRCLLNEPLAQHTSLRVGGPARLYVYPERVTDLAIIMQYCKGANIPIFIIGFGTNLLVSDDGFVGCVIDLTDCCSVFSVEGNLVRTGAALWLNDVVKSLAEKGLGGLDKLAGIPGGIGGGLWMNAGAFRSAISDHLIDVDVISYDGDLMTMNKLEVGFVYRASPGLEGKIVLAACFQLPYQQPSEAVAAVEATIAERYRRNVMTLPSAGSVFKNPPEMFSAKLIESLGLKGMKHGGVEISPLHANFIVNSRSGTASDIVELIKIIRAKVYDRYNVHLELELRTIGFSDGTGI